ncbi:MAG: hypothetical protein U1C59_11330 [Methylotenera sp.]|jgi:hypothetical protein|nr:hypothetical protein [Methylotenera sp.]
MKSIFVQFFIFLLPTLVLAENDYFPSSMPKYKDETQRNFEDAQKYYEYQNKEKVREEMRDKTHDGMLRKRIDGSQSIGVDQSGINYRRTQ